MLCIEFRIFAESKRPSGHFSEEKVDEPLSPVGNLLNVPYERPCLDLKSGLFLHFPDCRFSCVLSRLYAAARYHPYIVILMMLLYHQHPVFIIENYYSYSSCPHNNAPLSITAVQQCTVCIYFRSVRFDCERMVITGPDATSGTAARRLYPLLSSLVSGAF